SGFRRGQRFLESDEPSCSAMAHAVSVALSVLLDPSQPAADEVASNESPAHALAPEPEQASPEKMPLPQAEPAKVAPVRATETQLMDAERGAPRRQSIADEEHRL